MSKDPGVDTQLAAAEALILIRERTVVDAAFLHRAPNLKVISQTGKLARNIDIAACTRAGVAIVEGTGSPVAPAELTLVVDHGIAKEINPLSKRHGGWSLANRNWPCGE